VAAIEGDRSVGIDFAQKTAIGPASAIFPLGPLMRSVLPLISDLGEEELGTLHAALESAAASNELFAHRHPQD
jgi:hypothetical protein